METQQILTYKESSGGTKRTLKELEARCSYHEGFKDLHIQKAVALYIQDIVLIADKRELAQGMMNVLHYSTQFAVNYNLPASPLFS